MKRIICALLAAAATNAAWAQDPELSWNYTGFAGNATMAWAIQTPASAGKLPVIMMAMDDRTPGKAHTAQVATLEMDCARRTIRPVMLDTYDTFFVKTDSRAGKTGHAPFSGAMLSSLEDFCASRAQATREATVVDALRWLDSYQPGSIVEPQPPSGGNLAFELAGRGSDLQRIDSWLETTSIAKTGASAKAWVFEAWESGWQTSARTNFTPATWRLYEFDCQKTIRYREVWYKQLDSRLAKYGAKTLDGALRIPSDPTIKQIGMRVCSSRTMLFSEKFTGSDKELAASWYGASAQVGVPAKPAARATVTPVDLGPVIRMSMNDNGFMYTGTFTRQSPSSKTYVGSFAADTNAASKINDTLTVLGIRNGMLEIDSDFRKGPYAIPVANGKITGKGSVYPERANDAWSWTLVEPSAIVSPTAAPATPSPVAPQPVVFHPDSAYPWYLVRKGEGGAAAYAKALVSSQIGRIATISWLDREQPSDIAGVPAWQGMAIELEVNCSTSKVHVVTQTFFDKTGKQSAQISGAPDSWEPFSEAVDMEPVLKAECAGRHYTSTSILGTREAAMGWLDSLRPSQASLDRQHPMKRPVAPLSLVEAGKLNDLRAFIDLNSVRRNITDGAGKPMSQVWLLSVYPKHRSELGLVRSAEWELVRFDCAARQFWLGGVNIQTDGYNNIQQQKSASPQRKPVPDAEALGAAYALACSNSVPAGNRWTDLWQLFDFVQKGASGPVPPSAPASPAAPAPAPAPVPSAPSAADTASYALPVDRSLTWRQHVRAERESSAWADGEARAGAKPLMHIINHMTFDSTQSNVPGRFRMSVATIEYDCASKTYRGVYAAYHDKDGKLLATSHNGWGPVRFDVAHPLGPALQARCSGAALPAADTFTGNYVAAAATWLSGRH